MSKKMFPVGFSSSITLFTFISLACVSGLAFGLVKPLKQTPFSIAPTDPQISGLRFNGAAGTKTDLGLDATGVLGILVDDNAPLRFFGANLDNTAALGFTLDSREAGADCTDLRTGPVLTVEANGKGRYADSTLAISTASGPYYLCLKYTNGTHPNQWIHQGSDASLQIRVVASLFPLWVQIVFIVVLQCLSGLLSGLTLGVLSLDPTELLIIQSVGSAKEKRCAKHIMPLRRLGNFLLCSLAIGNVIVNSSLTILLDELTSGLYAIIFSTIGIVIFGEILPQAICSRYGLSIGSATRWITKTVMLLTGLVSWPLSKLLDVLLGREIGVVYDRERLVELIRITQEHNQLGTDEINIISGTLAMKRKTAKDVMTPLDEVFMLSYDAVLNFETLAEITKQAFTRIPVYEGTRSNIVSLLNIKDMALLDPDDATPVKSLCHYYSYEVCFVFEDATLDIMFHEFRKGTSHIAFVRKIIQRDEGDPLYELVGITTLEDIVEEMIQAEIYDESDKPANRLNKRNLSFYNSKPQYNVLITPQLQHAAYQFLLTSVDQFKPEFINEVILKRLIQSPDSVKMVKHKVTDKVPAYIYEAGKPSDFFVLILEGRIRVEIKVGPEKLVFESGPFTHFGSSALDFAEEHAILSKTASHNPTDLGDRFRPSSLEVDNRPRSLSKLSLGEEISMSPRSVSTAFTPDFTVYTLADVLYLKITREQYLKAVKYSSLLEEQGTLARRVSVGDPGSILKQITIPVERDAGLGRNADGKEEAFHLRKRNASLEVPSIQVTSSDEVVSQF